MPGPNEALDGSGDAAEAAFPPSLTTRDLWPLLGFVGSTIVIAYGVVLPRHGISGVNELTVGFGSTVAGACVAYIAGLRAALARRQVALRPARRRWRRPGFVARQSARPSGVAGRVLGRIMRVETAAANEATIAAAGISTDAQVLDLGCGAGHTVRRVAERLTTGRVTGIDPSPSMVVMARRHARSAIARGRAQVIPGRAEEISWPSASLDRVLSTHTVYFWPDVSAVAREVRRVLRPGGRFVLTYSDPNDMRGAFPESVYILRSPGEIHAALESAGFGSVDTRRLGAGAGRHIVVVARS